MCKAIFAAFVALLGSAGAAAAQNCPLPSVADTVALNPVADSDLMTVPVEINGKPRHFLLDISTNPTEVSQATVAELGLPESARMNSTIQTGGTGGTSNMGSQQAMQLQAPVYDVKGNQAAYAMRTRVRIGTFTIGGATARNMQFMVANDGEIGKAAPYDGLLTNDFFKQYDVELDFAGKQVNYPHSHQMHRSRPGGVLVAFRGGRYPDDPGGRQDPGARDDRRTCPYSRDRHKLRAHRHAPRHRRADPGLQGRYARHDARRRPQGWNGPAGLWPYLLKSFLRRWCHRGERSGADPDQQHAGQIRREKILGSNAQFADARIPDLTLGMDVLHQLHLYIVFGQKKIYVTAAALN